MNYFCLIDCDNFFATCEKIFHPQYRNRPLVVVSGKNGIVIARSKEAKALGIPMGAASFEYKSLFNKEDVITRSTNHTFYNDMANRVRETVATFALPTYIYSIDEMFLQIPKESLNDTLLKEIQEKVKRWTGVDVSIGVSLTKTLAKIATGYAKKSSTGRKILVDDEAITTCLKQYPASDLWGVGKGFEKKLKRIGVTTAFDLKMLNGPFLSKLLGVHGLRMQKELKGESAYPFQEARKDKSMQITTTFMEEIVSLKKINEILSSFISKGCEKLRKRNREASSFSLFLQSSRFKENRKTFHKHYTLDSPSNFTPDFLHLKEKALSEIIEGEMLIKRVGIHFEVLTDEKESQQNLFSEKKEGSKNKTLMNALDSINHKYGKKAVRFASAGKKTKAKYERSPCYTTNWENIFNITS